MPSSSSWRSTQSPSWFVICAFHAAACADRAAQWSVRTHKNLFWTVSDDGALSGSSLTRDERNWFTIEWLGDKIAFRSAVNGKLLATKKNGALAATGASIGDDTTYIWEIINRPTLILRGEFGFVGTLGSGVLECNKSTPEEYQMHITKGVAYISGSNGKYWKVGGDGINVSGSEPTPFFLELSDLSKVLIKHEGKYLQGFQNGGFASHVYAHCRGSRAGLAG